MDFHTIEICAGVGMLGEGLRAGLAHLGVTHRTVAYLEREAYAASVLVARMEEGSLDAAPVWPDLLTFDGRPWRGTVDCIAAGFPCQDLSLAGRRAGLDGQRSGLFFDILNIADACGARFLFLENVAGIASATASVVDEAEGALDERAAARVLGELADRGWDAEWLTLSASDVGASHGRARWFCFAWRNLGDPDKQLTGRQVSVCDGGQRRNGHQQPIDELGHADHERTHRAGRGAEQDRCAELADAGGCLADSTGHGRHPRRAESSREQGRSDAAECGGAVADTDLSGCQAIGACAIGSGLGREIELHSSELAHPGSPRRQGPELRTTHNHHRGGQETHGSISQLCSAHAAGLFAPGPADGRWASIISHHPHLAPALEPGFRSVVNGLAFDMDDCRAQRLKCVGNGVVALCAAASAVVLVRRSGVKL